MTDTDRTSPAANPGSNASAIDDAALDQVVGGAAAATTPTKGAAVSTQDIHFTKKTDAASPLLFLN